MFTVQDFQQDDDLKPPQFFQQTSKDNLTRATKIMQHSVEFLTAKNVFLKGEIILYEEYIAAQIEEKTYVFEVELTITFEANFENKIIKFKDCQRELQLTVRFFGDKDIQQFYEQIKRCFFQTNFEEKYQMLGMIGNGKTSLVFQVRSKTDGTTYAVKYYSNIPSGIQKEIKILKVLQHPNLIYFHEMYLSKGQVYLIMDYEDGGTLLDKINQKAFFTMKEKIKFLIDMLNAFEFLRIKDIVHRDLKPENILYSRKDGCYKIADFALAISEEEPINKLVGTPGYISPELFKSEEDIFANQYSDIYSLGLIYYQVATKKTYFHGQNTDAILKNNKKAKSLKKKKYSKQHISDLEYDILRMMIRTEPENRRLSLQILQSHELRTLVKEFALGKKSSTLSSTSSHKKSSSRKGSNNEDPEQTLQEENFMDTMKKILRMRSSV